MTRIQLRRDTAANWAAKNPIPAQGEPCYETDTGKLKIGDGSNTYANLPYIESGGGSYELPPATTTTLGGVKVGNNLSITEDGTLSATGGSSSGDVTQAGDNTFTGTNTFDGNLYTKNLYVSPTGKQWDALRIVKNDGGAIFYLGTSGDISFEMTDADAGLIVGDNMRDIHNTNTAKYYLKQDSITAGDNVSIEETTKGIKISATGGGATVTSDNGIRGDYESRYGIISSPNGILTDSQDSGGSLILTLHQGLVMQCAGQDAKTTISADTTHTVESTTEFDLFYAAGAFYEAAEVVFSETEPAGSDTGITAWFNPNKTANPDQKWQFKSNTNGNTWASAAAGRIAHIHTNGTAITRIDYAGCRILDGQHFLSAAEAAHAAMPSGKYIDLVVGASGATYTAPADGFFLVRLPSTSVQGTYMDSNLKLNGNIIGSATYIISFTGDTCSIFMPTPKNAILQLAYNLTFGAGAVFRFIYANGSAPKD